MPIKARLEKFISEIRPSDEHRAEANRQRDFMIDRLHNKVADDGSFILEKMLKAGSNAKFTSLHPIGENSFDVDIGAYYSGDGATKDELDKLLQFTCKQIRDIYGNTKKDEDFEILKSAVRIKFRSGIKLNIDVSPIVSDKTLNIENGGWIPRSDGWRLTSVTCHNEFVHKRIKESNKVSGPVKFNRLIRLVKWWNNLQDDLTQPSYFCDLVTAAAFEYSGVTSDWQTSLQQFFSFWRKHQFLEPIIFNDYYDVNKVTVPSDPVVILDTVNSENNIAYSWNEDTRQSYLNRIQDAYDAVIQARVDEIDGDEDAAIESWCRVFGENFRTLSELDEQGE